MPRVDFSYCMHIAFTGDVTEHRFALRCLPRSDERQLILDLEYRVDPASFIRENIDSFGNRYVYGCMHGPHRDFFVDVRGRADCRGASPAPVADPCLGLYRACTPLTSIGPALRALADSLRYVPGSSVPAFIEKLQIAIHEQMNYRRGVTNASTSAEQAFALRTGVCQDYVHIFLALLRAYNIPCRYVAGIVPGEGETHAWADVFMEGQWVGFDPTNCVRVRDAVLTLTRGRDAADCVINRGIFLGSAAQIPYISANLTTDKETLYD